MSQALPIFKREFFGYFRSPVAYVVLAAFTALSAALWIFLGNFYETDSASLEWFFFFTPWVFMFFAPATAMRLWAEERKSGTMELLLTLPVTTTEAVVGKFLAAWAFISIGVLLTFPAALTVAYLGDPDWGVMLTSYLGAILMAAAYLGICSVASALTRNQVIAFIVGLVACLFLTLIGYNLFSNLLESFVPVWLADALENFSFTTHFESMKRGLVDVGGVIFFVSLTVVALIANVIILER